MGFKPTIPVFERAKTVNALDHAAIVIDDHPYNAWQKVENMQRNSHLPPVS
jgi:hypothetical protein